MREMSTTGAAGKLGMWRPPPLFVLGVRRSGTTLLRVMLDRHSQLAIPDESYFIPQVAARHRGRLNVDAFCDDISRLPTLIDWGVPVSQVRASLTQGATVSQGLQAIYRVHAERQGKRLWGDKTPMYMQFLPLIERLFPDARFVHLVRDGRDAACSFLTMPDGVATETWAHPRSPAGFACQWRTEVRAARALGERVGPDRYLELRYEDLVIDPRAGLAAVCEFANIAYEPPMVEYAGHIDLSGKPHLTGLKRPPTPGLRDWRTEASVATVAEFEAIAGDLLAVCGYPLADPTKAAGPAPRQRLALAAYASRARAWRAAARALARSPMWRRRHPPVTTSGRSPQSPVMQIDHHPPDTFATVGHLSRRG